MKTNKITVHKTLKRNMGNYTMLECSYGMELELEDNEQPDMDKVWDIVNQQIDIQSQTYDQSWIDKPEGQGLWKKKTK